MNKLIFLTLALFSSLSYANRTITCQTRTNRPTTVLNFTTSSTPSARLNSDINYFRGREIVTIPFPDVAQFAKGSSALYFLTDNAMGIPYLRLYASAGNDGYYGPVTEFNGYGRVVRTLDVYCYVK